MSFEDIKNRKPLKYPEAAKDLFCCILLLLILCTVRFPSFFYSVFDWDESTITIVGQSILDGNLPYSDAWDIKPPLAYYIYASFIAFFGKSLFSIRLGGLLCIYLCALIRFRAGKAVYSRPAGFFSALFLIVFVSSGISGLSTMTEHILLVPISCIIYCLLAVYIDRTKAFAIGLITGMAVLVKTNMIFEGSAVLILLMSAYINRNDDLCSRAGNGAVFAAGVALPILVIVCYYSVGDKLDLLLKTNISVALGYVGLESSPLKKLVIFYRNVTENLRLPKKPE